VQNVATTSATNLTLSNSSAGIQVLTGGTTCTIALPAASSGPVGLSFTVINLNSGAATFPSITASITAGYSGSLVLQSTSGPWSLESNSPTATTLTGNVTGSGTGSIATTIGTGVVTWGASGMLATSLASGNVLGNISGSTGAPTAVPATIPAVASSLVLRDATQNAYARHFIDQLDVAVISATGTTTLTYTSGGSIEFNSAGTQYAFLPDATTLAIGMKYRLYNSGTSTLYVLASGQPTTSALLTVYGGVAGLFELTSISTAAGAWRVSASSRLAPIADRRFTNVLNVTTFNASATVTTLQVYNGPIRTSGNITLVMPAATQLNADLTQILGIAPPAGFNFTFISYSTTGAGNTSTWQAGSGGTVYPTSGALTLAGNVVGEFMFIIRSSSAYDFIKVK
jgi:hypothetical protein